MSALKPLTELTDQDWRLAADLAKSNFPNCKPHAWVFFEQSEKSPYPDWYIIEVGRKYNFGAGLPFEWEATVRHHYGNGNHFLGMDLTQCSELIGTINLGFTLTSVFELNFAKPNGFLSLIYGYTYEHFSARKYPRQ